MSVLRPDSLIRGALLAAFLAAPALHAQERTVVGKEVSVGSSAASVRLDFSDGGTFTLALRDGRLWVNGSDEGAVVAGSALDRSLRSLMGIAVALDDGPLAAELREWSPPSDLPGRERDLAESVDEALEDALRRRTETLDAAEGPDLRFAVGDEGRLLGVLLRQMGRLGGLGDALEGLDGDVEVHIQEDARVERDRVVDGSLLVVQADALVEGTVDGDVVAIDGTVEMRDGSRVRGNVRLLDARLENDGGRVDGEVLDLLEEIGSGGDDRVIRARLRDEIRDEIRDELRTELRNEMRHTVRRDDRGSGILRSTARAVGGVMENLAVLLVLGVIGVIFATVAEPNMDVVAQTARRSPGRSAMVGLAGAFLLVPVWILGMVALAVSIIGIPVLVAWIPLFPLAALLAALLGFLAVARNTGEWLADSDLSYTSWIRRANPIHTVFGGLLALLSFFVLANLLGILPWLGFFRGLLALAGTLALTAAAAIGFGSVLLTRAGRRPEYHPLDPDEAWRRAVEVDVDLEDGDAR